MVMGSKRLEMMPGIMICADEKRSTRETEKNCTSTSPRSPLEDIRGISVSSSFAPRIQHSSLPMHGQHSLCTRRPHATVHLAKVDSDPECKRLELFTTLLLASFVAVFFRARRDRILCSVRVSHFKVKLPGISIIITVYGMLTSTGPLVPGNTSTSNPTLLMFPFFSTPNSPFPRFSLRLPEASRLFRPLFPIVLPSSLTPSEPPSNPANASSSSSSSSSYAHASFNAATVKCGVGSCR